MEPAERVPVSLILELACLLAIPLWAGLTMLPLPPVVFGVLSADRLDFIAFSFLEIYSDVTES